MILESLNPKQLEAVKTTEGPVLIVAGPGSGKTKVLTHRIAYLIQKGITSQSILAVTFTNKAANEMKERVQKLLVRNKYAKPGRPPYLPLIGTFHSICARLLRQEAKTIGFSRDFVIFDDKDSQALIKKIMDEIEISQEQFRPQAIANAISQAKNELVNEKEYSASAVDFFQQTTAKIYEVYQQRLTKSNAMDFDDLIMRTIILFQKNEEILKKYQDQFKYILVDEYQDTNHAQYLFVNLLAAKTRNICAVGDFDQAIYAFRGADFRNILNFEKDYPEAKIVFLEQNYRSTQTILDAAQAVISKNSNRKEKSLWTENDAGQPVVFYAALDEQDESGFIIREVSRLKERHNLRFRDFTVLYRTNAQSRSIEEAFLKYGFPYKVVGTVKFYERKEIKDLVAFLRLIHNPADDLSAERIINVPPRGLGKATNWRELANSEAAISSLTPKRLAA
ncbi:MAG: UvrD-helicase domain-containing protein, partial [Candidatus Portnoybacteria bacterium]|nr:UvrD-helicase domain-containing protein [Candidatus Portnoybacteria bacterium]